MCAAERPSSALEKPLLVNYEIAEPKPAVLIESLRSVGYSLSTAIADIIDNSIAAKARNVELHFTWAGRDSQIAIVDDGDGMTEAELSEAMVPGSKHPMEERAPGDLGRFGLGLKTASFSQCRCLTVITRTSRTTPAVRCWNLDHVKQVKQWRLLKEAPPEAAAWLETMRKRGKGTLVFWSQLDRLAGGENTGDAAAHNLFNNAIDAVSQHLAMVFHRFIEDRELRLIVNGSPIEAWNPFLEAHAATYRTPVERIQHGDTVVEYRGHVLPHRDRLTDAEFAAATGPLGWNAQQGFYIYRNRRLLVSGDWLRLGRPNAWTKEEHYRLARIRLDITNRRDADWQLDVKKSTAIPPNPLRARLTDLAAELRSRARSVFAHRGLYGTRASTPQQLERPWVSTLRQGRRLYVINRDHPLVQSAVEEGAPHLDSLLRLLEETVPVQQIWLDAAEQVAEQAAPYETVENAVLRRDARVLLKILIGGGVNESTARQRLRMMEPFNRHPAIIDEL